MAELHRLATSGELGRILHMEGQISGPPGSAGAQQAAHWRSVRAENPAGGMTGKGIHLVDLMLWMCGGIASVCARSEQRVLQQDIDDAISPTRSRTRGVWDRGGQHVGRAHVVHDGHMVELHS